MTSSRRAVLKSALAAPLFIPARALGKDGHVAPSNRVALAAIGVGGRGTVNLNTFLGHKDVQVVAVCDPDPGSDRYEDAWTRGRANAVEQVRKRYAKEMEAGTYSKPAEYADFREVVARNDIDAVCISTPDHWHAAITVAAAKSGKDVYCEKPMSLTVADGRAMVDACERFGRIYQSGSQRRSTPKCRNSCELVRSGRIGKLHTVKVGLMGGFWVRKNALPTADPMPVPAGFDYEMWLGPAPYEPYTYNRCHWNFRWNLDYSGGMVTDWGAHYFDMAHWGMDVEHSGPVEVEGSGKFPPRTSLWNTAKEFEFTCTYANGVKMVVKSGGGGVRFEGSDGWVSLEGSASENVLKGEPIGPGDVHLYVSDDHHANFVACVKSRRPTAAPAEIAHRSITPAHLGNIAMQIGRKLRWDPKTERFAGDDEANRMLARPYRGNWTV
ncbi:MAG TPA: Gfo/Idh/MocA family oxidoreductase [Tepidisphaeraceae bacterium]|nr:Gfo/Idh/MocA family oxidoreductase [Tepidisphaeraceae bacterium]